MPTINAKKCLSLFCCLTICFSTALFATTSQAKDWNQWRGPNRDGRSTETIKNTNWKENPPEHVWTKEGFGKGYASVAIVDGKLYTTGNTNKGQSIIAADANTGDILWKTPLTTAPPKHGYGGSRCTPSIDGEFLYAIASSGKIACLNNTTGKIIWSKDFSEWNGKMMSGWGFSESPLIDGDNVLCTPGAQSAMIVCLNKKNGRLVWKARMPDASTQLEHGKDGAGYSSIIISNAAKTKQYVQMTGRGLVSFRASNGQFLWGYNRVANKTANIPTPVASGDYIFGSTGYGTGSYLIKLRKQGQKIVPNEQYFLTAKTLQNHHGGVILKDNHIFLGHQHNKGFPRCINMKTGKHTWSTKNRGPGSGSAAIVMVGNQLIFRYQDGTVALIEANSKKYKLNGSFMPVYQEGKSWAHPVVVSGKLYLREQDKLMMYNLGS